MEAITIKKRKPNWSDRELVALAEAVLPKSQILKAKFSPTVTSERKQAIWEEVADQVNSITMVERTVDEIRKKWADMQSLTKKKESERRKAMRATGGGPALEIFFKEWEKLALQSLSDVAIEGIAGGVDTAAYVKESSSVMLSQSASTPLPHARTPNEPCSSSQVSSECRNTSVLELPLDDEEPKDYEHGHQQKKTQTRGSDESSVQERYLKFELERNVSLAAYRKRKLELLEESIELQRKSLYALERIVSSMEKSPSLSVSPVIKFNEIYFFFFIIMSPAMKLPETYWFSLFNLSVHLSDTNFSDFFTVRYLPPYLFNWENIIGIFQNWENIRQSKVCVKCLCVRCILKMSQH